MRNASKTCAAALLGLWACAAQAAVVLLYSESDSGDLPTYTSAGGTPPVLAVTYAGISTVVGSWRFSLSQNPPGQYVVDDNDRDAFRFTVASGLRVTDISVFYTMYTSDSANSFTAAYNLVENGVRISEGVTNNGQTGSEALFDESPGGFVPLNASADPREIWLSAGGGVGTYWTNSYTLLITAETAAAVNAVPEPAGAALALTALGAAGLSTRRRRLRPPAAAGRK